MTAQIAEKFTYEGREYRLLYVCAPADGNDSACTGESTGALASAGTSTCEGTGASASEGALACEETSQSLVLDLSGAGLNLLPQAEILRLEFGVEQGRFLLRRLYTAKEARDADLPLAYTGRLLVCRGLLHRYYSEAPWSYQESLELVLEQGVLRESNDVRPTVRAARELLFSPERQEELYALAEGHWWLSRSLGLSGSPANAPKIAVERIKSEHF